MKSIVSIALLCAVLSISGCNRNEATGNQNTIVPEATPIPIKRPSKTSKIKFGEHGLELGDAPFFIPCFNSKGDATGGIQSILDDVEIDASAIDKRPFDFTVGIQQDTSDQFVTATLTAGRNSLYVSADGIIVAADQPNIAPQGPFLTLRFRPASDAKQTLTGWAVEAHQDKRTWNGKTTDGFALDGVTALPIDCTIRHPTSEKTFSFTVFPKFRGGQRGLVTVKIDVNGNN